MMAVITSDEMRRIQPYINYPNYSLMHRSPATKVEGEDGDFFPFSQSIDVASKIVGDASGSDKRGREMYCGYSALALAPTVIECRNSAIRLGFRTAKKSGKYLSVEDVEELRKVMKDGCDRIEYPNRFMSVKADKRRKNCHEYVDNKLASLVKKATKNLGLGVIESNIPPRMDLSIDDPSSDPENSQAPPSMNPMLKWGLIGGGGIIAILVIRKLMKR